MKEQTNFKQFLLLIIPLILFSSCMDTPVPKEKPYLVIVSLDGFRWDYATMAETPNLDSLAKAGVKTEALVPSFPTKTFPNHYSLATGLYPDHHGIVLNGFYAPELKTDYRLRDRSKVENPKFYDGEPIWVTAEKQGVKSASFFWVGSEAPIKNTYPSYWKSYDHDFPFDQRIDTVIHWLKMPEEKRPQLIMLYFHEPDHIGHVYGPASDTLAKTVEYLDKLIGKLAKKLNRLPINDQINLIVLSDHGMGDISDERVVYLEDHVDTAWFERIVGWNPNYTLDVKEDYTDMAFEALQNIPHVTAWKSGELPERFHYGENPRTLDFVLLADSSWSLLRAGDSLREKGTHGYDNQNTDMHAIFYASGPAFKNNYGAEAFPNVQIYSIAARILNLKPMQTDGNIEEVKEIFIAK